MGEGISPEIGSGTTVDTGTSGGTTNRVLQKATLKKGKTLRLMAEEHYGNREFWVYIYLENKGKISNPNRVPSGTVLLLPDKSNYSIDATNPQSVAKAKTLGDEVLKKF